MTARLLPAGGWTLGPGALCLSRCCRSDAGGSRSAFCLSPEAWAWACGNDPTFHGDPHCPAGAGLGAVSSSVDGSQPPHQHLSSLLVQSTLDTQPPGQGWPFVPRGAWDRLPFPMY